MILININNQDMEIKYDVNSICMLEERTGKGLMGLLNEQNMGLNIIRMLLWAGLKHKQQQLTPEIAGQWIQNYLSQKKSLANLMEKVTEALKESGVLGDEENKNSNNVGEISPT